MDLELVRRLEAHGARAWPATICERTDAGWLLRATPGLDRGRSNHALTPSRELAAEEIAPALHRVEAFARAHSIPAGIQVSPIALHGRLQHELDARGWSTRWPALVLLGDCATAAAEVDGASESLLEACDHASEQWLRAWARCEPGRDVAAHAATVLELLRGRATFARLGQDAVGISVEADRLVGLYCLAVAPERRREGIGTTMVRTLLGQVAADTAYLQVEARNAAGISMYARLGFQEAYRYCHRAAPD